MRVIKIIERERKQSAMMVRIQLTENMMHRIPTTELTDVIIWVRLMVSV